MKLSPDANRLLSFLGRGGKNGYFWTLIAESEPKKTRWYRVNSIPQILDDTGNLYFGVNPVWDVPSRGNPEYLRAERGEVCAINCLFAEFDAKDYSGGKEAALQTVRALSVPASVMVDSGGGYHAYWLLAAPFLLATSEDRDRAISLQARWVEFVGGDPGAKDLARVLRVPGSTNRKPEYNPARPVEFVKINWECLYTVDQLEKCLPEPAARATMAQEQRNEPAAVDNPQTSAERMLNSFLDKVHDHRDDSGFVLARQLQSLGLSAGECEPFMMRYQAGVSARGDHPYTEKDAMRNLKSAFKHPPMEPPMLKNPPVMPGAGAQLAQKSNGHKENAAIPPVDRTPPEPESPPDLPAEEISRERRREILGEEYVQFLRERGYSFSLCELDDSLWVNNERMTDPLEAEIRTLLRDNGYPKVNIAQDAYLAHARKSSFHPIVNFLQGLHWDGCDHIAKLAGYIADKHGIFPLALRKFLIGAVARPMTGGKQNRVLVLEGDQGIGKSRFAQWLGSPLEGYFSEAMPDPDNKDSRLALATTWLWEIKELGSVTRRADRESLKAWLTLESISERMPFGKYPIYKPAMTSFIATVNDEGGFFNDPTGTRRFMTVAIKTMNWAYSREVDVRQLWAQAMALYTAGEDWNLTPDEQKQIGAINDEYEFSLPSHDWLDRYIEAAPGEFLEAEGIRQAMAAAGDFGRDAHMAREIAGWMKKHGYEPGRAYVKVKIINGAGMPEFVEKRVRGYTGAKITRKFVPSYQDEL